MKPLIGLTAGTTDPRFAWGPDRYALNRTYPDSVEQAGGLPIILPIANDTQTLRDIYERLDGVLLTGGDDVDPSEYNEAPHPKLGHVSPDRDRVELQLAKWAVADDKPLLAICRGIQILNVALGGSLYQDIESQVEGGQDHDISTHKGDVTYAAHELVVEPESKLAEILGQSNVLANSHHHQAIKKVAPGLSVTSRATDGIIESVELANSRFVVGVQSHPETMQIEDPTWCKLFEAFINSAHYRDSRSVTSARKSSITDDVEVFEAL